MIRDILRDLGYKVKKFTPAWNHHGFKGYGLIEFGVAGEGFKQALMLERKFHQEGHSKAQWMSRNIDAWPYLRLQQAMTDIFKSKQVQANREADADILDAFGNIKIWLDNMMNDE
ncbi:Factor of DNA methylation 4 [Bienertia sinuspersici]